MRDLPANHRFLVTEGVEKYGSEAFKAYSASEASLQPAENLPAEFGTWLLTPVMAPKFGKGELLCLRSSDAAAYKGNWPHNAPPIAEILVDKPENEEIAAVYTLLFRSMFDRHRDLPLPTSFLLNDRGKIVKVYQGQLSAETVKTDRASIPRTDAERIQKALPFAGIPDTYEFGRNYLSLGSIFFQRGYADYAEDFFQSALKQDQTSAEAFYGLGSVYLKQGKNGLAQQSFESCVRLASTYPETTPNGWNNLGLLATREGNTARAIGYFEQAIQVNPNHFIALENLGNAYKQQKQWDAARTNLEKALALKPQDAEANYSLGMVFAQVNEPAKAYEYIAKALAARPAYPEALNNLGILYLRTHRRDDAVGTFEKCIQAAPEFEQSYLNLARVYAIEGNSSKAREVLNALLSRHPDNAMAKQTLSQLP